MLINNARREKYSDFFVHYKLVSYYCRAAKGGKTIVKSHSFTVGLTGIPVDAYNPNLYSENIH